jgi:DNA topoisomerase VI subunit B
MKRKLILIVVVFLALIISAAAADTKTALMDTYRQVKSSLEQAYQSKANVYAKDVLEDAGRTLAKAMERIDTKDEKTAADILNKAVLQIELAKVKTEEREAAEKTAVTRARADKLSQRLNDILSGKGDAK